MSKQHANGQEYDTAFAKVDVPDFVDLILKGGERADEAMYYLLHQRLKAQLERYYDAVQHELVDDFDDVLDDFFLYLRDGNGSGDEATYPSLRRIRKKDAFLSWMLRTFRNYLGTCTTKEFKVAYLNEQTSVMTDEEKLFFASRLIAYVHQMSQPRDSFIFLRTMLTLLNKRQALPNKEMAQALGMTDIAYRVTVHRMKNHLAKCRSRLMSGEALELDEPHQLMAESINDDFLHLYPTLLEYYNQTIDTLSAARAVKQLRLEYGDATGTLLHEQNGFGVATTSISDFWNQFNRLLATRE